MWYICYDKVTGDIRRVVELSSQAKADAISKYRMSESMDKRPSVDIIAIVTVAVDTPIKTERERLCEILGITETDISQIKKIAAIEQSVEALKPVEEKL